VVVNSEDSWEKTTELSDTESLAVNAASALGNVDDGEGHKAISVSDISVEQTSTDADVDAVSRLSDAAEAVLDTGGHSGSNTLSADIPTSITDDCIPLQPQTQVCMLICFYFC